MTCALLTMGTALKSKVSKVLPAGNRALAKMPLDAAPAAVGHLVFGECRQKESSVNGRLEQIVKA